MVTYVWRNPCKMMHFGIPLMEEFVLTLTLCDRLTVTETLSESQRQSDSESVSVHNDCKTRLQGECVAHRLPPPLLTSHTHNNSVPHLP